MGSATIANAEIRVLLVAPTARDGELTRLILNKAGLECEICPGLRTLSRELANGAGFTSEPALPFFLERYAAAYRAELAAFIEAVDAGTAPIPSGQDGLAALLLADAATVSARTGQPVTLGA